MQRNISALSSEKFDLLVVGAGVHGACVARDAALRGLKVAIIDKDDICGATSHNSLKTIHGGIRYLQHFNFKRTLESIKEQKYWLETAAHLVKPIKFMMPTYGFGMRGPIAMYIGIRLYELLSLGRNRRLLTKSKLSRGKILSKQACMELAPNIPTDNLTGGAQWDEAQVEFADRAVMQVVQHAVEQGAVVANYVSANNFIIEQNAIVGVNAVDELTKSEFIIKAKLVINAAGPWVAELLDKAKNNSLPTLQIPMSKSMNVVTKLPAESMAIGVQSTLLSDSKLGSTKRLYFMVPWQGVTIIGTTHFPYDKSADVLEQNQKEIAEFVAEINRAYPSLEMSVNDVIYCYQGLGPADDNATSKATQLHHSKVIDHAAEHKIDGMISIIGVKWTTARLVAERAVNLAVKKLKINKTAGCETRQLAIPDYPSLHGEFSELNDSELIDICQAHIKQTMAIRLTDILLRRTNDLVSNKLTIEQISTIARTMSAYFSWTVDEQNKELNQLLKYCLATEIKGKLTKNIIWGEAT